jgi:hypothetical protein
LILGIVVFAGGNHELYNPAVVEYMLRPGGYVDWWGDRYITSNVKTAVDQKPLGQQYQILRGKTVNVLVFGFLYNLPDPCTLITVSHVETEINAKWFAAALEREEYDAILVLAHMDLTDPLVTTILTKIRSKTSPEMPVQFVTGHTHYRGVQMLDDYSATFEAGRYLDTLGFVSFPTAGTALTASLNGYPTTRNRRRRVADGNFTTLSPTNSPTLPPVASPTLPPVASTTTTLPPIESTSPPIEESIPIDTPMENELFKYVFIDANLQSFQAVLGITDADSFHTSEGRALSEFIHETQHKMGLHEEIGCADKNYLLNVKIDEENSLWRLFRDQVFPSWYQKSPEGNYLSSTIMLLPSDSWRYDLLSTTSLSLDDIYAVAPYNDTIVHMGDVSGAIIMELQDALQGQDNYYTNVPINPQNPTIRQPNYFMMGTVDDESCTYMLYTHAFAVGHVLAKLEALIAPETVTPFPMPYTTTMMWLSFVSNTWPCPGDSGPNLPAWFPSSPSFASDGQNKNMQRAVLFSMGVIAFFFVAIVSICFFKMFRILCCSGHTVVEQSELDAFKMDGDYEEDVDVYNMDSKDTAKTETGIPDEENENELL